VKNYKPAMTFDEATAGEYDARPRGDEEQAVACLAELARGGPALELAIGTGRVGLPLAERGIRVDGIDISQAMIDQLRAKPGGESLSVTLGDFADVPVDGSYRLIFVVANTFFNLLTQDDQVRCFENVAKHLTDDGLFVIEAGSPDFLYRLRDHQYVDAEQIEVDEVRLDVARHDPVTQLLEESHVTLTSDGVRLNPIVTRYAWPSELDLMGRIAGLRLKERWGSWDRQPYAADSTSITGRGRIGANVISVYGR
jgi:SAM-dependent methyltransferase